MRAVRYSLREALISLRRAGRSAAMSIGTVAVAFLTLGGFLLATTNIQHVVAQWGSAAEMSVFLKSTPGRARPSSPN
jgi:cell division protein FtsX